MTAPYNPLPAPASPFAATPEPSKKIPVPAAGARPDEGPMDDSELQAIVDGAISHSIQYIDQQLSPDRAKATDYYMGRPFGNEEDGRSQYISTDVRDSILGMLPSLLRVVFGAERPLDFAPKMQEDVPAAEQATDYVDMVFQKDNPGFLLTHSVLKDGLLKKLGAFKWAWDESYATCAYRNENMTVPQIEQLLSDPESEIELTRVEPSPYGQGLFNIEYTREEKDGRVCLYAVPPEEIIFTEETRDAHSTLFIGHRTEKTKGELVAMGIDPEELENVGGGRDNDLHDNAEEIARQPSAITGEDPEGGEANEKMRYVEGWFRVDYDGDGIAELRRICTVGRGNSIVVNEPTDHIPLALFCPDPEPHTIVGLSLADRTMDIQKAKSMVARATLDSLALSIFPRMGYVEGQVNAQDMMTTAIGSPIRMRAPGMVQPIQHEFVGREGFPILTWFDDVIQQRVGRKQTGTALDSEALQSSTKGAVDAAITQSQEQVELVARIFVETTLKSLFRGILKLLVTHQPRARMVRLRNQWVDVDPRSWNADMDMTINVALGSGLVETKIAALAQIAAKQELYIQTLGPSNPLVDLVQLSYTNRKIVELLGFKDTTKFFKEISDEQLQKMAEAQSQQQPPPDPALMVAQAQIEVERMKAEANVALKQKELELKALEIQLNDDRERDAQAAEHVRELKKIELDHEAALNKAQLSAEVQKERATNQAAPGGSE